MTARPRRARDEEDELLTTEHVLTEWARVTKEAAVMLFTQTIEAKEIRGTLKRMFQRWADAL